MEAQGKAGPTTAERRLWGRRGALLMHGRGRTNVAPAHAALAAKWERLADPDGTLTPEVRARRASMLRRAHMLEMSSKAAEARRNRKAGPDRISGPASPQEGTPHARPTAA